MLVLLIILSLSVIFGFLLLGIKLSETIKEADNKLLFWILYVVTLLSFLQLTISIIFFIKYRKKVGPIGPRGFMGERGDKGDEGKCGINDEGKQDTECRYKSLMLLIEKNFRDSLGRELDETELKNIHNFVYLGALSNVPNVPNRLNGEINLNSTTYEDLNKFNNILISEIEIQLEDNRTQLNTQNNIILQVLEEIENKTTISRQ